MEFTEEEISAVSARLEALDIRRFDAMTLELAAAGKPLDVGDVHIAMYRKLDPTEVVALIKTDKGDWAYGTAGQLLKELITQAAAAGKQ